MSRIEELREIRAKVEAGEVDSGTLEQLVYGLAAEVEVRLHNEACQRAELETCNAHIDAQAAQIETLRAACEKVVAYHDPNGPTVVDDAAAIHEYITLCRHALAATADGEGK